MARPIKAGLDYFELDCYMDQKVKMIQAEYKLKGFAVIVKLWQKIYSEFGYYCEWNDDALLLFMLDNGLDGDNKNFIKEVVAACIRRDIFSETLFNKYQILTSKGIQERYLNATSRRERVELKKEYLLLSDGKIPKNAVINSINANNNSINVDKNPQSKVEKSKVKNNNTMCKADALALFEQLWHLYPNKKGKGQVSDTAKKRLLEVGYAEMTRAVERYKTELEKDKDWRKPQNGSTFFNSGYIDYLDANYVPGQKHPDNNKFNNFKHNDYDFNSLEADLLSN